MTANTPKTRKAKGRVFQNFIAERISKMLRIPWGKDEAIKPRTMGESGVDIILTGKAKELFPSSIEIKAQESWSIPAWIRQSKNNQRKGTFWLLFCKQSRHDPIVIMDAEFFFELYENFLIEAKFLPKKDKE